MIYKKGLIVRADVKVANNYFKRAADLGNDQAQLDLETSTKTMSTAASKIRLTLKRTSLAFEK